MIRRLVRWLSRESAAVGLRRQVDDLTNEVVHLRADRDRLIAATFGERRG